MSAYTARGSKKKRYRALQATYVAAVMFLWTAGSQGLIAIGSHYFICARSVAME
jgi:hypothetical protein